MRKILLVLCVIFLVTPHLANANNSQNSENKSFRNDLKSNLRVTHIGHGEYKVSKDFNPEGETATLVDGQDIYQLKNGTYLSYIDKTKLVKVEKVELKLSDRESVETTLASYEFDDALVSDIRKRSDIAIERGNESAGVILYTTSPRKQEIGPLAQQTSYYTYNGHNFKIDLIYFTTLETGYTTIVSGYNAADSAKTITNFIIALTGTAGGTVGTAAGILSIGMSIFDGFSYLIGHSPITGQYNDLVQVNVRYDINTKYTYLQLPDSSYMLGAVTERAYIHRIETYMYFVTSQGGRSQTDTNYIYETYATPSDAEPWKKALYWAGDPWTEYVNMKIYGHDIYF